MHGDRVAARVELDSAATAQQGKNRRLTALIAIRKDLCPPDRCEMARCKLEDVSQFALPVLIQP